MKKTSATLPILPAGTHVALDGRPVEFTEAILQEIVDTYDASLHEAPMVIGHPKLNGPAYGWAKSLEVRGGMLYAEPHQVVPEFAEAANRKMYKKRSASVYLPNSPGNPTPGKHYLRHIGFLGAMPPAIKGIPDAELNFAEEGGELAVEFAEPSYAITGIVDMLRRLRDFIIEREGAERADQLIPQWQLQSVEDSARREGSSDQAIGSFAEQHTPEQGVDTGEASAAEPAEPAIATDSGNPAAEGADTPAATDPSTAQDTTMNEQDPLDERERSLADREAALAQGLAALAAADATEKRNQITEFAESLVAAGKLLPRQKDPVIELMCNLPAAPLEFSEAGETVSKAGEAVLRELLEGMPAQVDFAEKSQGKQRDLDADNAQAIADKARVYQAEQKKLGNDISISAAVRHITKELAQ